MSMDDVARALGCPSSQAAEECRALMADIEEKRGQLARLKSGASPLWFYREPAGMTPYWHMVFW